MGNRSISQHDRMRDLLVASLCLLVFCLALSAKLAVYRDAGKTACDPVANTKLCLSGVKMDAQAAVAPILVLTVAMISVSAVLATRRPISSTAPLIVITPKSREYPRERFLRPPPTHFSFQF